MRQIAGISLRDAARRIGINPGQLSTIERGLTEEQAQKLRRIYLEAMTDKVSR